LGQFIFDVPVEVEPELLIGLYEDEIDEPRGEAGNVDLTEAEPTGPGPDEILALQYQYFNMSEYEQAYEWYASESKARVSEQTFVSKNEQSDKKPGQISYPDYSFPTVNIEGDHATMQVVRSYEWENGDSGQDRFTQEAVLEDEGWRIVMRDDQYQFFGG
jgi:hypothetical protein